MAFYTFTQNNSGGWLQFEKDNISEWVIIEADSYDDANKKALEIGIYFGLKNDCPCCGSRWAPADDGMIDEDVLPSVFGKPVVWPAVGESWDKRLEVDGYIHFKNGQVGSFNRGNQ